MIKSYDELISFSDLVTKSESELRTFSGIELSSLSAIN